MGWKNKMEELNTALKEIWEDAEGRVIHAGQVSHAHTMRKSRAYAVKDIVKAAYEKVLDEVLSMPIADLTRAIFRPST